MRPARARESDPWAHEFASILLDKLRIGEPAAIRTVQQYAARKLLSYARRRKVDVSIARCFTLELVVASRLWLSKTPDVNGPSLARFIDNLAQRLIRTETKGRINARGAKVVMVSLGVQPVVDPSPIPDEVLQRKTARETYRMLFTWSLERLREQNRNYYNYFSSRYLKTPMLRKSGKEYKPTASQIRRAREMFIDLVIEQANLAAQRDSQAAEYALATAKYILENIGRGRKVIPGLLTELHSILNSNDGSVQPPSSDGKV